MMGCGATSASNEKMHMETTGHCKHAKLRDFLGAVAAHLISKRRTTEHGLYAFQLLAQELFHAVRVPLEDA